jgi:phage gp29-like protein
MDTGGEPMEVIPLEKRKRADEERLPKVETPYIRQLSDWDVSSVLAALDAHERGDMNQSGLLWQWCQRDERLKSCLGDRAGALPSLPFTLDPATETPSPEELVAAEALREGWHDCVPEEKTKSIVRVGVGMGVAVGHLHWKVGRRGFWWPRLTVFPGWAVRWDENCGAYKVQTRTGAEEVVTPGDGRWFLWEPEGDLSFQYGALLALAIPCLVTSLGWQDLVNFNDAYGHPIIKAKVPRAGLSSETDEFLDDLRSVNLRERRSLTVKTGHNADGSGYDFEYVTPGSSEGTVNSFERQIELANKAKAIVLKGQTLTTDVADSGSRALGDVHQRVESRLFRGDAQSLSTTLRRDICKPWARFNYGRASLAPWPRWNTDPLGNGAQKTEGKDATPEKAKEGGAA